MKPVALTLKSNSGLLRVLASEIDVIIPGTNNSVKINAIWDTGASGTAITTKVVQSLGLIPTGMAVVSTANGPAHQNTYSISVGFPSQTLIEGIVATEVPQLTGGCDALIGMDIINIGDFSITNHNGQTCMSFRMPSSHEVDYVKTPEFGIVKVSHADELKRKIREENLRKAQAAKAKKKRR